MSYQVLTPDPAILITGLRDTGYNLNTALADVVDNSVDAFAENISISIDKQTNGEALVTILDDGIGMNKDELLDGMKYGSSSSRNKPPQRLGKFGLGLKTASTAFCRKLSVISKKNKEDSFYMATWDLDRVARENRWDLEILEEADISPFYMRKLKPIIDAGHGTLVVWEKADRLSSDGKTLQMNTIKKISNSFYEYAAMIYHKFLDPNYTDARNITMKVNGVTVEPYDPYCKSEMREDGTGTILYQEADKECSIILESGEEKTAKFHLAAYIIPHRNNFSSESAVKAARLSNTNMGFYVYRENRMIADADWLGLRKKEFHQSLCRIEFNFDHDLDAAFQIDVKKSRIVLNPDLATWLTSWSKAPVEKADERYRWQTETAASLNASDYHRKSDKNLQHHEKENIQAEVNIVDGKVSVDRTMKVAVKNPSTVGKEPVVVKIEVAKDEDTGIMVIPTDNLNDGLLWKPTLQNGRHAVLLNKRHPFYQKVYIPNHPKSDIMCGLDAIFWTLSEAYWATINEDTKKTFNDLMRNTSYMLRNLVEDMDDPEV